MTQLCCLTILQIPPRRLNHFAFFSAFCSAMRRSASALRQGIDVSQAEVSVSSHATSDSASQDSKPIQRRQDQRLAVRNLNIITDSRSQSELQGHAAACQKYALGAAHTKTTKPAVAAIAECADRNCLYPPATWAFSHTMQIYESTNSACERRGNQMPEK